MYEKQEEYENKKKESKQAELEFREQEKELRAKDRDTQDSMIQFSKYLQANDKIKLKADEKIKSETELLHQKEIEHARKLKIYQILEKKAQRIELKKNSLLKFENYLDKVKKNSDEFSDISEILSRHKTLIDENEKLNKINNMQEARLEEMKRRVQQYEKDKRQEILQLNNDISKMKSELEAITDQQNKFKAEAEEINAKKRGRMSEFAQLLMAIDNIEQRCFKRQRKGSKTMVRHPINDPPPKELFDSFDKRCVYAKQQLKAIQSYLKDFKIMSESLLTEVPIKQAIQQKRDKNEFI